MQLTMSLTVRDWRCHWLSKQNYWLCYCFRTLLSFVC